MPQTKPDFAINKEISKAFLIRLTWDGHADTWHIMLKPVNGEGILIFHDVESALLHLESVMKEHRREGDQ